MSEPISVVVLTKNNAAYISDLLASLKPFLTTPGDELVVVDTGSTDTTVDLCTAAGAKVFPHPELCVSGMHDLVRKYLPDDAAKLVEDSQFKDGFLSSFAAARQIANDHASNDLVFWIDSDDVLIDGANLRAFCADFFKDRSHEVLFLKYDYSFDVDGACTTELWRERIARRSTFHWAGVCHESLIPRSGVPTQVHRTDAGKISHKHGRSHLYSDIRNYAILRNAYDTAEASGEWLDPRWDFYLGNACRGLSRWDEAIFWYTKVLNRSGSREDRLAACLNIAYTYILFGRAWRAIDWFFQALKIHPEEPRAYYGIARAYFELKQWGRCLLWTNHGRALGTPPMLTSVDPNSFTYYPNVFAALSLKELGRVEDAVSVCRETAALRPNSPDTEEFVRDIEGWAARTRIEATIGAATNLAFSIDGALDMVRAVRPELRKLIPALQVETYAPTAPKCVTFLCGKTFESWDGSSIEAGVGGSEKMVILLGEAFARYGARVEVYGNPHPDNAYKTVNGVTYRPAEAFNPAFERDVLIVWRNWGALDLPIRARKIFIDLHDVQNPGDYTPARLAKLDGAFYKSNFHLEPVKSLIGDKAIVTRNAISPALFPVDNLNATRNPKRFLYTSSADRGLKRALTIFARLKKIDPEVTLDVYYGFTPLYFSRAAAAEYSYFGDENCERSMLDYYEDCCELAGKLGVKLHGRVGSKTLADALRGATAVIYPTSFPEISCMSAMEAQAAGCLPICTDTGALKETVKNGIMLPEKAGDDLFLSQMAALCGKGDSLNDYRTAMANEALSQFSIEPLASEWFENFFVSEPATA